MEYEIVAMPEKITMGITARTNNLSPDMGAVIGGLWKSFYEDGFYGKIPGDKTGPVMGIYSDYAGNERDDYDMTVACEVEKRGEVPEGMTVKIIPAGKYAKFVIRGHVQKAVAEFWQGLWKMDLNRAFLADYEEYLDSDMENGEIHIYIGLKEA